MLVVEFNSGFTRYSVIAENIDSACEYFFRHCIKYNSPTITDYKSYKYEAVTKILKIHYKSTFKNSVVYNQNFIARYSVKIIEEIDGQIFIEE